MPYHLPVPGFSEWEQVGTSSLSPWVEGVSPCIAQVQQSRVYMCKHTHTTLMSKCSQTQMTSRFSLITVLLNHWFSRVEAWEPLETLGGGGVPKAIVAWEHLAVGLRDLLFVLDFRLPCSPFRSSILAFWGLQMPWSSNCKPRLHCCISPCNWEPTKSPLFLFVCLLSVLAFFTGMQHISIQTEILKCNCGVRYKVPYVADQDMNNHSKSCLLTPYHSAEELKSRRHFLPLTPTPQFSFSYNLYSFHINSFICRCF